VPAVLVSLRAEDGSRVEQTPNGSRVNRESARLVVKMAIYYAKSEVHLQIGIITPYRGQVSQIKRLLRDKNPPKHLDGRIKIGTIHAFQGSEADVIIWDLVETEHLPVGRLYHEDVGSRLTNVAISRAQGKLLIVGDVNVFVTNSGANKVKILKGILVNKFSEKIGNVVSARELGY